MHLFFVKVLQSILKAVSIHEASVVTEAGGLQSAHNSRHGNAVALDFLGDRKHMVIDAVVTSY